MLLNKEELHLNQEVKVVEKIKNQRTIIGKIRAITLRKLKVMRNGAVFSWFWKDIDVCKAEPDIYYCDIEGCKEKADYYYGVTDIYICHDHIEDGIDEDELYIIQQSEVELKKSKTARGFSLIEFEDRNGDKCNIQQSSLATERAIWFGVSDPNPQIMAKDTPRGGNGWVPYKIPKEVLISTRMHLTQLQVKQLLSVLKHFAETGEVNGNP